MRHLLLVRHAKSSHKNTSIKDHDRDLNKRGERDLLLIRRHFIGNPYQSTQVLTSSALRALRLAETIAESAQLPLSENADLYTFSSSNLLSILQSLPDASQAMTVVGHNPAITDISNLLSGDSIPNVPTSGCVHLQLNIRKWSELSANSANLVSFEYPKIWR